jgi:hypothetical protein
MKVILFILFSMSINAFAEVTFQDCLDDALLNGSHTHALSPLEECAGILDAEADKVENVSGLYRAYGKSHMIYVDKKDAEGNVIERTLLSGDQTELVGVQKLFLDVPGRRLYVIQLNSSQKPELMVHNLDFLGNVTPLNVMKSDALLTGVTSVKAEGADKIEIVNAEGSFLINADAESRTSRSVQKAVVITPK